MKKQKPLTKLFFQSLIANNESLIASMKRTLEWAEENRPDHEYIPELRSRIIYYQDQIAEAQDDIRKLEAVSAA